VLGALFVCVTLLLPGGLVSAFSGPRMTAWIARLQGKSAPPVGPPREAVDESEPGLSEANAEAVEVSRQES
jgi:hypothetical protein